MKVHFKYPRKVDGKEYSKGQHDLPDSHANHWYVKALIKQGDVTLVEPSKADQEAAKAKADADLEAAAKAQADADAKAKADAERIELEKMEAEEQALSQPQSKKRASFK